MKIGIDLHGVSDAFPTFFAEMTRLFKEAGHEVIIITGPSVNEKTIKEIEACGLSYTSILSIVDYHIDKGTPCSYDADGNFWVDDEPWNKTKAELCREHGIDFHIDDSPHYGKYFSTPYMQVNIKK
jgi:hypothetical protein